MTGDHIGERLRAIALEESAPLPCCICGALTLDLIEHEHGDRFPYCDRHERDAIAALARSRGLDDELAEGFADHVLTNPDRFEPLPGREAN